VAILFIALAAGEGLSEDLRNPARAAALVMLAFSHVFFALQRVPKGDMESLAVVAATWWGLSAMTSPDSTRYRRLAAFVAGSGILVAPFVKIFSALFSAAAILALLSLLLPVFEVERRQARKVALPFACGIAVGTGVWVAAGLWISRIGGSELALGVVRSVAGVVIPSLASHAPVGTTGLGPSQFEILRFFNSNLYFRHPVETLFASLAAARVLVSPRKAPWRDMLLVIWLAVGVGAFSMMAYAPLRYRMIFLPALAGLAAREWSIWFRDQLPQYRLSLVGALAATPVASIALERLGLNGHPLSRFLGAFATAYIAILTILHLRSRFPTPAAAVLAALALIAIAVPQWWEGEKAATHSLNDIATEIRRTHEDAVLCGLWGMSLALRNGQESRLDCSIQSHGGENYLVDEAAGVDRSRFAEVREWSVPAAGKVLILWRRRS
jgi:hypothetical protein